MNEIYKTEKFENDFKRLRKRYRTLDMDLEKFEKVIRKIPFGRGKNFNVIRPLAGQKFPPEVKIIKARLACEASSDHSLRAIYAYWEKTKRLVLVEMYHKNDKANPNQERIQKYLKDFEERS